MPRYVILRHEVPKGSERESHWDLMLEAGGVLQTWALDAELAPEVETAAIKLPDHRLAYLDYEGPVGGDRGHVTRWDHGDYVVAVRSENELAVSLSGEALRGNVVLRRCRAGDDHSWRVSFAPCADNS